MLPRHLLRRPLREDIEARLGIMALNIYSLSEVIGSGVIGELVLTTLTKEALPLLRYRTRDLTTLDREPAGPTTC